MLKRDERKDPHSSYYEFDPIKSKKRYKRDKWFNLLYRTAGAPILILIAIIYALYHWIF